MKKIMIIILISLIGCSTSITVIKGDRNSTHPSNKVDIDSLQLLKNNPIINGNG